ncbi:MAG TPA: hypothetical protein VK756_09010 [Solirubrobacteraceae bacterium]|jgi:hypothetical protein|nr:hypothetical protein [Solirubrobacteraceae bacterium]
MKTVKTLFVALVAVFALTAVSATAASAHTWMQKGVALKAAVKFESTQELRFSETALEIECAVSEEGTVGPGAAGEIKSVKATECHSFQGCEASHGIEIGPESGLPWKTELVTLYEGLRNRITTTNAKWKIHCQVAGSNWTNYCEVTPNMAIVNAKTSAEEVYDGKAPHGNCVYGPGGNFNTKGGGLLLNRTGEPFQAE